MNIISISKDHCLNIKFYCCLCTSIKEYIKRMDLQEKVIRASTYKFISMLKKLDTSRCSSSSRSILFSPIFGVKSILHMLSPILSSVHSGLSPFWCWALCILCWVPFWFLPIIRSVRSEFGPFWFRSTLISVHSELVPFWVQSNRGWVHSGLSTYIWGWVYSGLSPFRYPF